MNYFHFKIFIYINIIIINNNIIKRNINNILNLKKINEKKNYFIKPLIRVQQNQAFYFHQFATLYILNLLNFVNIFFAIVDSRLF